MTVEAEISFHGVELTKSHLEEILHKLKMNPMVALQASWIRHHLSDARLERLSPEDISYHDEAPAELAVDPDTYRENYLDYLDPGRMERLIRPLRCVDFIYSNANNMNLLTVGPASEAELLSYVGMRFPPDRIHGIDLASYNVLVRTGDMHQMPFGDSMFHVAVLGWALSLSRNPKRVALETARVVTPGGYVAVGGDYAPEGSSIEGRTTFGSVDDLLAVFGNFVHTVIFRHDVHPSMRGEPGGDLMAIFKTRL